MNHSFDAFHTSVAEDPLFAAEGMDLDNAASAIDALESALRDLEPEYADGSLARKLFFIRYPLTQYAVPISFLRNFLAAETARRTYIASPSSESANALLATWDRASDSLAIDLSRYRKMHDILVHLESSPETFVMQDMFGYLTSYRYVMRMLDAYVRNAAALKSEVAQRRRILEGAQPVPAPFRRKAAEMPRLQGGEVSAWHKQLHDAEIAGGVSPYRYADVVESHGPFRFRLANFDGQSTDRTCVVYILKERTSERRCLWIAFIDRFYFKDIWNMLPQMDGVTRGKYATAVGLSKEEIPYWYEGIAYLYNTRDLRYWMDIATAVDTIRRPELDWNLAVAQKSSMLDLLLAECARDTRLMIAHLRRRKRSETAMKYSMMYDLLTRTYPSVYYLPFNKSVWRLAEEPQLIGDDFQKPDPTRFISEDVMKSLSPDIIQKVFSVARLREERGQTAGWLP